MTETPVASGSTIGRFEQFLLLLEDRFSCRGFRPDPVARPIMQSLLAAAQRAPSWSNIQPWRVYILSGQALRDVTTAMQNWTEPDDPDVPFPNQYQEPYLERRRRTGWRLYQAVGVTRGDREQAALQAERNFQFFDAPHTAVITSDRDLGVYGAVDCGIYVQTFILAATALGIGTIVQAAPARRSQLLRERLELPASRAVLCVISFGYVDLEHPANSFRTDRAPLSEIVTVHE